MNPLQTQLLVVLHTPRFLGEYQQHADSYARAMVRAAMEVFLHAVPNNEWTRSDADIMADICGSLTDGLVPTFVWDTSNATGPVKPMAVTMRTRTLRGSNQQSLFEQFMAQFLALAFSDGYHFPLLEVAEFAVAHG